MASRWTKEMLAIVGLDMLGNGAMDCLRESNDKRVVSKQI